MDALSISRHTLPMGSQPLADNSDDELPAETEPIHHPKPDFNTAPVEKRFLGNTQTLSAAQQSFTVPKPPLPPPLNATPKLLHPASESPSSPGCRLFVWGTNHTHQLGLPSVTNITIPTELSLPAIQAIAAGGSHALAATPVGEIFAWGNGDKGQLGLGASVTSAPSPQVALELAGCVDVSAGGGHSLAVGRDGRVFAWGNGVYGQLGLGLECEGSPSPREVEKLRGKAICKVVENRGYFVGALWTESLGVFGGNGRGVRVRKRLLRATRAAAGCGLRNFRGDVSCSSCQCWWRHCCPTRLPTLPRGKPSRCSSLPATPFFPRESWRTTMKATPMKRSVKCTKSPWKGKCCKLPREPVSPSCWCGTAGKPRCRCSAVFAVQQRQLRHWRNAT